MRRRAFTGPVEGAAAASSQAVRALPDIAAEGSVQKEEQDFPLVIASVPATGQHRMVAAGTVMLLVVAAAVIAPFASIRVARVDAFIPVFAERVERCRIYHGDPFVCSIFNPASASPSC